MAKQKIIVSDGRPCFAIHFLHTSGLEGWMTGAEGKVQTYPTEDAANKALRQLKKSGRYSWQDTIAEVREFHS